MFLFSRLCVKPKKPAYFVPVIPAKAGIQSLKQRPLQLWIPTLAGMTISETLYEFNNIFIVDDMNVSVKKTAPNFSELFC